MRIGFTGTQMGLTPAQAASLERYLIEFVFVLSTRHEYHHGDCIGADAEFHDMVADGFDKVIIHPPTNKSKRAFCVGETVEWREPRKYLKRNADIANECDLLIACPRTMNEEIKSGTWHTIRTMRKLGKKVVIIWPDGSLGGSGGGKAPSPSPSAPPKRRPGMAKR